MEYIILRANRAIFAREVLVVWNEKKSKGKGAVCARTLHRCKRKVLVPIWRSMMDYTAARVKKIYTHRINYHNIVSNVCALLAHFTYQRIRQSIKWIFRTAMLFIHDVYFIRSMRFIHFENTRFSEIISHYTRDLVAVKLIWMSRFLSKVSSDLVFVWLKINKNVTRVWHIRDTFIFIITIRLCERKGLNNRLADY